MTDDAPLRCLCGEPAPDRRALTRHLVGLHGATVRDLGHLPRASLIAYRIEQGEPQDARDLALFTLGDGGAPAAPVAPPPQLRSLAELPSPAEVARACDAMTEQLRTDLVGSIERLAAGDDSLFGLAYHDAVETFRRQYLTHALLKHGGARSETAKAIGLSPKGLLVAIASLGIQVAAPHGGRWAGCGKCGDRSHNARTHDQRTAVTP